MQFAIAIPQFFGDGEVDPGAFREYFARAEELGYDGAWAQEAPLGSGAQLSAMEAGTPEDCAAAVREVINAGAGLVLFTPLDDPAGHAERVAAQVIPAL